MYNILIADDEQGICDLIKKYAAFEGHNVTEVQDGLAAVDMCKKQCFDIIILDVMMPELDGFSACREIRKFSNTPIIMLSARVEEYDRIHGFESGADDYVVKPFSPKELFLRIEAIIKRSGSPQNKSNSFDVEGLHIDYKAHTVEIDDIKIQLSPREYELLLYLVRNANVALSRNRIINDVWGYDFYGGDRTLDTHIKLLRKHLGSYSGHIVTVRGVGYRFESPQN